MARTNARTTAGAWALVVLVFLLAFGSMSCGGTNTAASIRGAPAPPAVTLETEPKWAYIRERDIYVVDDDTFGYDLFRTSSDYYLYDDGYWYHATAWDGPYASIRTRFVPSRIFDIGDSEYRWRLHPVGWRGSNR